MDTEAAAAYLFGTMYRVEATPNVEAQLAKVAGLRERVEETLIAILEAAREVRRVHGSLAEPGSGFLRVQVRDHVISYTLDLDRGTATVVFAEQLPGRGGGNKATAA